MATERDILAPVREIVARHKAMCVPEETRCPKCGHVAANTVCTYCKVPKPEFIRLMDSFDHKEKAQ